ncbi:GGDEF domain-containing protein [Cellulomonas soli]
MAHHALGQDSEALAAASRSEQLARENGELVWQSRALAREGLVHHDLGNIEDAVDLLTRAVELRREADDVAGTADVLTTLGTVYTAMPHFAPQAAGVLTQAHRLWLQAGDPDRASIAHAHLARTFVETSARLAEENPRGARAAARRALALALEAVQDADAAGLSRTSIDARFTVATAHVLADDLPAAGLVLDTAADMLDRFPSAMQRLALHRIRAGWLMRSGRYADATREATAGLVLCDELRRPAERAGLLQVLVDAEEAQGNLAGALDALHELHDLTVRTGDAMAERRAALLGARMELDRAERVAESERRRSQELEEHNARLAHEAAHDPLTGLANRRALDRELARRLEDRRQFTVALVDVDHFKRVNDTWSHQTGDAVLQRIAHTMRAGLRTGDLAARYGGEEFALVLDGLAGPKAMEICERLRARVEALVWDGPMSDSRVTVSIGVSAWRPDETVDLTLARADAGLYEAKAGGRNQVRQSAGTAA